MPGLGRARSGSAGLELIEGSYVFAGGRRGSSAMTYRGGKKAVASGGVEKICGAGLKAEAAIPGSAACEDMEGALGRTLPARSDLKGNVESVPPVVAVHVGRLRRAGQETIRKATPPRVLVRDLHYSCECDNAGGREFLGHGEVLCALARQAEPGNAQKEGYESEFREGTHA